MSLKTPLLDYYRINGFSTIFNLFTTLLTTFSTTLLTTLLTTLFTTLLTGGAAQSIQSNGGYIKNLVKKTSHFSEKDIKITFLADLFASWRKLFGGLGPSSSIYSSWSCRWGSWRRWTTSLISYTQKWRKNWMNKTLWHCPKFASPFWRIQAFFGTYWPKRCAAAAADLVQGEVKGGKSKEGVVGRRKHSLENADLGLFNAGVRHLYAPDSVFLA